MKNRQLEVYIAKTSDEIERALSLRYRVFNLEMQKGLYVSTVNKMDRDIYDDFCEHLIVMDKEIDDVVGTYRLLKGNRIKGGMGFYSETEFDLASFYKNSHTIMEIGRSCVDIGYRDGSVIRLLWQGLADCIIHDKIRYLIGCASFHSPDAEEISEIFAYFREKGYLADEKFHVEPRYGLTLKNFNPVMKLTDERSTFRKIPALIKGYMRAGARICGPPAMDDSFGTADIFVLFDAEQISDRYRKKFLQI